MVNLLLEPLSFAFILTRGRGISDRGLAIRAIFGLVEVALAMWEKEI